jgi:hypothetical protein
MIMPESECEFEAEILENEVVIVHVDDGHIYHLPILSNGAVSLHGARIEPPPQAKREGRSHLVEAHNAAGSAFDRPQV